MTPHRLTLGLLVVAVLVSPKTTWAQAGEQPEAVGQSGGDDFYDDLKNVESEARAAAKQMELAKKAMPLTGVFREERCGYTDKCLYDKYCYYDSRGDLDHWVLRDHGTSVTAYVTIYEKQVQYNKWVESNRSHKWIASAMIDPRVCLKGNGQWCDQYRYNPDYDTIPDSNDQYGTINADTLLIPYYEALPAYQFLWDHYQKDLKEDKESPQTGQAPNAGLQMRRAAILEVGARLREFQKRAENARPLEQEWCKGEFQIARKSCRRDIWMNWKMIMDDSKPLSIMQNSLRVCMRTDYYPNEF